MTKLWIQVRGAHYTRSNAGNTITFTSPLVDENKTVSIATVTGQGPWVSAITGSPQSNRLGRTLSFRLNLNSVGHTGFGERLYTPIVADFVWAPSRTDKLTLKLLATSEQATRAGGLLQSRSARTVANTLLALRSTVITVEFSDGSPTPAIWTMFVEDAQAVRKDVADAGYGVDSYSVALVCRRLS